MMDKDNKHIDNLSLTGYRVIAILKMLQEAPHTEAEINEKLNNDFIVSRSISKDSIWLYINTLKAIGCHITRPTKNNGFKYTLKDHPFKLTLTDQEINSLAEIKKYVSNLSNWEVSINFDRFLSTVSEFLDDKSKKLLVKTCKTSLREIDYTLKIDLIRELEHHCNNNNGIMVNYNSPYGGKSQIKLLLDQLKYENGALYLWGYNIDMEDSQYLRVDRIESIIEINLEDFEVIKEHTKAVFKLYGIYCVTYHPEEYEKIIYKDEKSITVETIMKSKFKLVQKILSFGKNCDVIEPVELKQEIVKRLKLMEKIYKT